MNPILFVRLACNLPYRHFFKAFLEKLIEQAEQKIEKANRRIDAPLPDSALLSEEQQRQVDQLHEEISKLLTEAEKAGERVSHQKVEPS